MTSVLRAWKRIPTAVGVADKAGGRFLILSAATGVAVGVGAWILVELLGLIERGVGLLTAETRWALLAILPLGLLAAWAIARYTAREVSGDGVPEAAAALIVRGGAIRGRVAPLKIAATSLTIGVGGSAGREGPIVLIGASIGSKVARIFNLGEDQVRSLVAAGAGAGIGAAFNAPIAGMLFALEVILSSFAVRHMSSIVIASVAAAITSRSLIGAELALNATSHRLVAFRELILYAALALVIVVVAVVFLRLLERLERWAHRRRSGASDWMRPVGFGLVVAAVALLEPALLGTDESRLLGSGHEVTNHLLESASTALSPGSPLADVWWVLGLVALGKVVASSLTLTSGGSGGAFMPSLFVGAMVGTGFAKVVAPFWGISELSTGSFAVVGMAAMFAAMGRAPLTAILLVFEVTGTREYGLILPLMMTSILATFLAELFQKESVYTMPLRLRGIAQPRTGEVDILDTINVGTVMSPLRSVATPDLDLATLRGDLERQRSHGAPVVDAAGALVGIITVTDMVPVVKPEATTVAAVMTRRPVTATPGTPVSHAMERMAALGVGRLPVVSDDDPTKLVGMFRREDAVRAYHEALGSRTDHQLVRSRLDQRTHPGAGYFEFRVPPGSVADGYAVKDVNWSEGSTLVSVRRGRDVMVPGGRTVLHAGDVVTAFGSEASRATMIERMNAGADEPTAEIDLIAGDDTEAVDDPPPSTIG